MNIWAMILTAVGSGLLSGAIVVLFASRDQPRHERPSARKYTAISNELNGKERGNAYRRNRYR